VRRNPALRESPFDGCLGAREKIRPGRVKGEQLLEELPEARGGAVPRDSVAALGYDRGVGDRGRKEVALLFTQLYDIICL